MHGFGMRSEFFRVLYDGRSYSGSVLILLDGCKVMRNGWELDGLSVVVKENFWNSNRNWNLGIYFM